MTYTLYQTGATATLSPAESADLAARVASLAGSGMPLEAGLVALADELPGQQRVLRNLAARLSRGEPFDQAVNSPDSRLPATLRGLIAAGLRCGRLPQALEEYASLMRRQQTLERQSLFILLYPAILSCVMAVLMVFYRQFIVHDMNSIFKDFGTRLPSLTEFVLWAAPYAMWGAILFACVVTSATLLPILLSRFAAFESLFKYIPVYGRIVAARKWTMICELLALLLENKVPIPESLELAADASDSPALAATLRKAASSTRNGVAIDQAFGIWELPKRFVALLAWGQSVGDLPGAFRVAAGSFDGNSRAKQRLLEVVIAPTIYLIIVGGVALSALGLMLPLLNLITSLCG